ncbi:MAG: hypothetical protein ISR65_11985 [Bacteriovoracaceae bacterium]|nr:hypothetical protein [Bacteriovoracaceae bacterium]
MKKLIISVITLIALISAAQAALQTPAKTIELTPGDQAISFISEGEIIGVDSYYPPCPPQALCQPASLIRVVVTLNSCVNKLGPVTHTTFWDERLQKYRLIVSASEVYNKMAASVRCFAPQKETLNFLASPFIMQNDIELTMMR